MDHFRDDPYGTDIIESISNVLLSIAIDGPSLVVVVVLCMEHFHNGNDRITTWLQSHGSVERSRSGHSHLPRHSERKDFHGDIFACPAISRFVTVGMESPHLVVSTTTDRHGDGTTGSVVTFETHDTGSDVDLSKATFDATTQQ